MSKQWERDIENYGQREQYRARLDAMVCALADAEGYGTWDKVVASAASALAAIDAEVERRFAGEVEG